MNSLFLFCHSHPFSTSLISYLAQDSTYNSCFFYNESDKKALCIVHLIRNSLRYVSWKDSTELTADLKLIYRAATLEEAEAALEAFAEKWDPKYPAVSQIWLRHWENIIPIFDYPMESHRVIYTTNPIESVNRSLRKVIKTKGVFPDEASVFKLMYLALHNISKKWTMPVRDWKAALSRFAILFPERFPL